jgi:hypothetical protein
MNPLHPFPANLPTIHSDPILPSTFLSSEWSLSSENLYAFPKRFPEKNKKQSVSLKMRSREALALIIVYNETWTKNHCSYYKCTYKASKLMQTDNRKREDNKNYK